MGTRSRLAVNPQFIIMGPSETNTLVPPSGPQDIFDRAILIEV